MVIFELVNVGFRDLNSYNDKELKLNSLNKQQYTYLKLDLLDFQTVEHFQIFIYLVFCLLFTQYFFYDLGSRFLVQTIMIANGKYKK